MGTAYDSIDQDLRAFITAQRMFFVATAPSTGGHVNLSPKGLDTLRIIDGRTVAYLDYVGSGAETIAHLPEGQRPHCPHAVRVPGIAKDRPAAWPR